MPTILMYSTAWCGDCRNTKRAFREAGIDFTEIDIDRDDGAAEQVVEWSGGRRVIPTIHFAPCEGSSPEIVHNPKGRVLDELIRRILASRRN